MKIVFNGLYEKKRAGCPVCGGRKGTTQTDFVYMKTYILPSGITKTFRKGRAEEVSDTDGSFLLSYKYTDKQGNVHNVFEVA